MDWSPLVRIAAGLVALWLLLLVVLWVFRPRDVRLAEIMRIVPDMLRLVRDLIRDGSAPFGVRAASVVLVAWLLNPVDIIPEFIPLLGPLDDVVIAVLVLRYVHRRLGATEFGRRWPGTPEGYALLRGILGSSA